MALISSIILVVVSCAAQLVARTTATAMERRNATEVTMRVLLDTNIVIHREATKATNHDVGVLYRWLDNLHYTKCIHPLTVAEINKLKDGDTKTAFNAKLASYNVLKTTAPISREVSRICDGLDTCANDVVDTALVNEAFNDRVDVLVSEDKKVRKKARLLGIPGKVLTIDQLLERINSENPELTDYKVLAVKKELFGDIDLKDPFFDTFRQDYPGFDNWFNRKSEETAYVCRSADGITAFLFIKREDETEPYGDIEPPFTKRKRLKIGTFKVVHNGYRLGERFLKIVFDNALQYLVDEVYVTAFERTDEQRRLLELLETFGFVRHGVKRSAGGDEQVLVRTMAPAANLKSPRSTYPYINGLANVFLVPIYPEYHTELFPDSILNTEQVEHYSDSEPYRNSIRKVYISRSIEKNLVSGDIIIFYRTSHGRGFHHSVATTLGIVERVITNIRSFDNFVQLCQRRSVFSEAELLEHWNRSPNNRPFVVDFLYAYSFPKRPNLARLIELGVIRDVSSAPRGFTKISRDQFMSTVREAEVNDRIIVD